MTDVPVQHGPRRWWREVIAAITEEGIGFRLFVIFGMVLAVLFAYLTFDTAIELGTPTERFTERVAIPVNNHLCPGDRLEATVKVFIPIQPRTVLIGESWFDMTAGEFLPIQGNVTARPIPEGVEITSIPINTSVPSGAPAGHEIHYLRGIIGSTQSDGIVHVPFMVREDCE